MSRKKLSSVQAVAIGLLWLALVALLFVSSKKADFETVFTAVASGFIVLIAVLKNR